MKLSKNFTLDEFTKSETAAKLRIDNTPPKEAVENLTALCVELLQPLREIYGKPMQISSGYRCEALNKAVGGVATSDHRLGKSADVKCENPRKLLELLVSTGLSWDQAILYPAFLHLSYRKGANRKQVLYNGTKPL